MQIDKIHELELTIADDAAIGVLLNAAFGSIGEDGFRGRSYYKQRHHLRVIMRDEGKIVGHIAVLFRVVRLGDQVLPIIGLAEVATHPDRSGKGIAGRLLEEVIAMAPETLAQFILLFGTHPIYGRHGFVPGRNELRYLGIDEEASHDVVTRVDDSLQVMALGDAEWDPNASLDLMGHLF